MKDDKNDPELGKLFIESYASHPANMFTKLVYRLFNVNLFKKPYPIGSIILVLCWLIGTIGMIISNQLGLKQLAFIFACILSAFFLFIITLPAYIMNKLRIRKIIKELGITPYIYNYLAEKYINE
jgi:hypothetical protein